MPYLRLLSIECKETEDWSGADEASIRLDGTEVWSGSINDGESKPLDALRTFGFSEQIRVELFDLDEGGPDNNDSLGVNVITGEQTGVHAIRFRGDGANYTINYEVTTWSI